MKKNNFLKNLYQDSLGLLTDLYELTMGYGYWKSGLIDREAVFQLFFRKYPFEGTYALCAGMETALEYLQNFHFAKQDLDYLAGIKTKEGNRLFEEKFLEYLANMKLELDIDAIEEGTPVFPYEPLIRVKGPVLQAQLMESALLNIINFQTLIATKASRICFAARGDRVIEFGLRRAQGIDGALSAARAAFIGGCDSTSNVLAGKLFNIPVMGTMAHSWVMIFDEEKDSFKSFAQTMPSQCFFLIDTYDSVQGAQHAVELAKKLKKEGVPFLGVRLDSGDLDKLSRRVRKVLDEGGFPEAKIMASNELNEQIIADLKHQGALIDIWAVGTNLVTAKDQPALDGVYKLSAVQDKDKKWSYRLKISEQVIKTTTPGISQVRRYFDERGYIADMLYDEIIGAKQTPKIIHHINPGDIMHVKASWKYEDLLVPMMRKGKIVYQSPSLEKIREKTIKELNKLEPSMRRFLNPEPFFAGIEERLYEKKLAMIEEIRESTKKKYR